MLGPITTRRVSEGHERSPSLKLRVVIGRLCFVRSDPRSRDTSRGHGTVSGCDS
jgi:hypothetical protein